MQYTCFTHTNVLQLHISDAMLVCRVMYLSVLCLLPQDPRFDLDDDQSKIRTVLSVPIKAHRGEVTFVTIFSFISRLYNVCFCTCLNA